MPHEQLIDRIYEAAFIPEVWVDVLDQVAAVSNSAAGTIGVFGDAVRFVASDFIRPAWDDSGGRLVPAATALPLLESAEFEKNVPRETLDGMRYVSDGKSYKLVAVGTGDCAVVRVLRPAMVDPQRSAGRLDCIAYGFWTPKGEDY